ncbi:hypothetical protein [Streptacidiphilus monticola]|jgi:hypothetical protein|uniref:DUF1059 domain-containing protein n=1 Tax=Streptacidiphilus monticola TaxID=2161674 RepID=A0ABW1FXE3_9ACTN
MTQEPRPAATTEHRTDLVERGSFCTARCSCGWFAPARRSRDRARRDVAEHLDGAGGTATADGVSTVLPAGEPSAER